MNNWEFVIAGYLGAAVGIGSYAVWVIRRGRRLTQKVPVERRRFLD